MQAEISMVTMKTLSNNKGISLVVLIVAMTLIAILGTSFVSLMGSKQKGFLYQINSYRALNLANAGVEYAIRIVYDNISSPESAITQCPLSSLTPLHDFANGQFRFCYEGNTVLPDFNSLTVEGWYDGGSSTHTAIATRKVKISNVMNYMSNSSISRIPYNGPTVPVSGNRLTIPFINSSGGAITITAIRLTSVFSSGDRHLQQIYFTNSSALPTQTHFFDYSGSLAAPLSNLCSSFSPPCNDDTIPGATGIKISSGMTASFPPNILPMGYTINSNLVRWCIIDFLESSLAGTYVIEFFSGASSLGSITF
jgi:Tfp pilus assembly protein PilX